MTTGLLGVIALLLALIAAYLITGGRRLFRELAILRDAATAAADHAAVVAENLAARQADDEH